MNIEYLKENKFILASIPVIFHIIYLIFSFLIDKFKGFKHLMISFFTLPPLIIGQLLLFCILKLFSNESNIPVYILSFTAITYILFYLKRIILFQPYDHIEFSISSMNNN